VHVTLDEAGPRLRPQVEAELLRIAQEAINNARRHSGAENLWVTVEVQPPRARIVVLDDGAGVQGGRSDSHGLRIMRERAERVDADLRVVSPAQDGRGTRLEVRLAAAVESGTTKSTGGQAPAPHQGDEHADSPRRR
jgi:signal transduction histidine kinase